MSTSVLTASIRQEAGKDIERNICEIHSYTVSTHWKKTTTNTFGVLTFNVVFNNGSLLFKGESGCLLLDFCALVGKLFETDVFCKVVYSSCNCFS